MPDSTLYWLPFTPPQWFPFTPPLTGLRRPQHRHQRELEERQGRVRNPHRMAPRLCLGQSLQLRQDASEGATRQPGGEDQVPDGRGRCRGQAVQAHHRRDPRFQHEAPLESRSCRRSSRRCGRGVVLVLVAKGELLALGHLQPAISVAVCRTYSRVRTIWHGFQIANDQKVPEVNSAAMRIRKVIKLTMRLMNQMHKAKGFA